jgi:hypothetical protein
MQNKVSRLHSLENYLVMEGRIGIYRKGKIKKKINSFIKSMFEKLYILCLFYHGQDLELRSRKSLDPIPDSDNHNTVQLLPSQLSERLYLTVSYQSKHILAFYHYISCIGTS